jgi:hypothetical protein
MSVTLLYLFTYTSWGLGLFSAFMALAMKIQEHSAKMKLVNIQVEGMEGKQRISEMVLSSLGKGPKPERKIPENLLELMAKSPDHPEVNEIEPDDEVFGVLFKSQDYPPSMEGASDDE